MNALISELKETINLIKNPSVSMKVHKYHNGQQRVIISIGGNSEKLYTDDVCFNEMMTAAISMVRSYK